MLLLPPLGVLAVFLVGTACGMVLGRLAWIKAVFNLGQMMLSVVVGSGDLPAHRQRLAR